MFVGVDVGKTINIIAINDRDKEVADLEFTISNYWELFKLEENLMIVLNDISPELVVVEGYAYASKFQSHQLGEKGWAIRRTLIKGGFRWLEVQPSKLKKFVTGKGNASKDLMLMNCYKNWGVEYKNHNQADAFGLAKIGQAVCRNIKLNAKQTEVINSLNKEIMNRFNGEV